MMVDDHTKTRISESVPDPLVGRDVDGYHIDEILGRGGMGVVYKATQRSLGRPVAIKVLPEEVTENRQFLDRFEREVDILARLSHPNIVTVFERGVVDGRPYIVMELVRGTTLRDVMRKGPLPPGEALLVVRSVLSALEHAHDEGIIHRDIKPENVLVAPGGIVKVADFGLSRHLEGEGRTRLTKTYVALGTFEYMSPEQREMARDADARSDLYATGVVLYEMIAGELPIGSFEPLSRKRPNECDQRIDAVVDRSLKKAPESRFSDAREMGDAVSRLLSNAPFEPAAAPLGAAALAPDPQEDHGPRWKRVISSFFGKEYPLARIEGKLPRKFAEKVMEDVEVQRYLGRLVPLWPHFPGGMEFSKEGSRLKLELEGMRGDDPVRDKRVVAAIGAVLEANSHGKLKRIAVADHAWEDANQAALERPPIVAMFAPLRPSDIGVQSQLVSGVERRPTGIRGPMKALLWSILGLGVALTVAVASRVDHSDGMGHSMPAIPIGMVLLCGLVAAFAFILFVVRGSRNRDGTAPQYNYWFSLAVTALWVGIVASTSNNLRDEEILWLCVGAIASVFLLPRIPALIENAGRALLVLLAVVLGLGMLGGFFFLTLSAEPAPESYAEFAPVPDAAPHVIDAKPLSWIIELASAHEPLPAGLAASISDPRVVRERLIELLPAAAVIYQEGFELQTERRTIKLCVPHATREALQAFQQGTGMASRAAERTADRNITEFAGMLRLVAEMRLPMRLEHLASAHPDHVTALGMGPAIVEPLLLPEVEPFGLVVAKIEGDLPEGWIAQFREDAAAWAWIRRHAGTWPAFPDPAQVLVTQRDGEIRIGFDDAWQKERLVDTYRNRGFDDKAGRELRDEWLRGIAVGAAVTLEARHPGVVKRTALASQAFENGFKVDAFKAR